MFFQTDHFPVLKEMFLFFLLKNVASAAASWAAKVCSVPWLHNLAQKIAFLFELFKVATKGSFQFSFGRLQTPLCHKYLEFLQKLCRNVRQFPQKSCDWPVLASLEVGISYASTLKTWHYPSRSIIKCHESDKIICNSLCNFARAVPHHPSPSSYQPQVVISRFHQSNMEQLEIYVIYIYWSHKTGLQSLLQMGFFRTFSVRYISTKLAPHPGRIPGCGSSKAIHTPDFSEKNFEVDKNMLLCTCWIIDLLTLKKLNFYTFYNIHKVLNGNPFWFD